MWYAQVYVLFSIKDKGPKLTLVKYMQVIKTIFKFKNSTYLFSNSAE